MTRGVLAVRTLTCVAVTLVVAAGVVPAHAQKAPPVSHTAVTDQMLSNAAADSKNWLSYGKDYSNTRYASSRKITTQNVGTLIPRWVYQTGGPIGSFETTPLVVDGVMYLTTPFNHAIALDARTGKQLWRYEHKQGGTPIICCGPNNRGLAAAYGRVYMATLDAHLVALDQKTGKVVWDVQVDDPTAGYSLTIAPLAYKGMIIVGNSGAEYGVRGFVDAYNATDGKRVWRFLSVPHSRWVGDWRPPASEGGKDHHPLNKEKGRLPKGRESAAPAGGGRLAAAGRQPPAPGKRIRKSQAFVPQENMFAQPTAAGVRMLPGANGGSEWSPVAYSPDTRMVYVLGLHQPMNYITPSAPFDRGKLWLGSAFVAIPGEEQSGTFTAIDVNTGKIAWQNKLPDPLIGGALATAGGVVFTGGDGTGNFYAFDAKTGKELWRFQCGAGVNAAPISFEVDGEQFIAVAAGGNFQLRFPYGDSVFIFGLPKRP